MGPLERYRQDLQRPGFSHDPAQEHAVRQLQRMFDELIAREAERADRPWWRGFVREKPRPPVKGLYFWGGVGRGKTYLVDTFFDALPFERKMRLHFHRFMRRVHAELRRLQGEKNPLDIVAEQFASEVVVLCFDEFFVSDIGDAIILGSLMGKLFERGVSLVATSNIVPDRLYEDGLQRARFVPAIELIKIHTDVINVDSGVDYRLRVLEKAEIFHWPLDAGADASLEKSFASLAQDHVHVGEIIEINGRPIQTRKWAEGVLWCDFRALCDGPRSQNDYIEIACEFHSVLLGNVPGLGERVDDQAKRFINLVDEFYDRNVKLILSSERPVDELYTGGGLSFEFRRTRSRLLEMQSREYLARPHKP
jgi:cell division protein ZapE